MLKQTFYVLLFACCFAATSFSQEALLSFSPGAKAVGMGKCGVVEVYDPSAVYWNPASLGALHNHIATLSIQEPFSLNYAGYAHFLPLYGSFAFSIARTYDPAEKIEMGSFGYGFPIGRHLSTGISLSALQIDREGWTTAGAGLLFRPTSASPARKSGLLHSIFADRFTFGLAVQHIPIIVSDYDHQARIGVSYSFSKIGPRIIWANHFQRGKETSHAGIVFSPHDNFDIISGLRDYDGRSISFGAQIKWQNMNIALVYDNETKRMAFTTSFRIGLKPELLAQQEYEKAARQFQQQDKREALKISQKALAYDPYNADAGKMIQTLEPVIEKENKEIDSLLVLANSYEKKKYYISAAVQYMKALKMNPGNKKANVAIQMIRPKVNIHTERWYQSGVRYFETNDYQHAKEIFEYILLVRPDHAGCKSHLERIHDIYIKEAEKYYYTGLGFYSQRNLDRAEEEFKKALQFQPNYSDALYYIDKIRQDRQSNSHQVSQLLQEAETFERTGALLSALVRYQNIMNIQPDNAIAKNKTLELSKSIDAIVNRQFSLGKAAYERGDLAAARKAFNAVASFQPSNSGARHYLQLIEQSTSGRVKKLYDRAVRFYENQQWQQSLAVVDSLLAVHPDHGDAKSLQEQIISRIDAGQLLEAAKSEYLTGQYLEALEKFNQVLLKDADNADALELREQCQNRLNEQVEDHYTRGIQFYTEEKYRQAIDEWNLVLQINPYHSGALEYRKRAEERIEALGKLP